MNFTFLHLSRTKISKLREMLHRKGPMLILV